MQAGNILIKASINSEIVHCPQCQQIAYRTHSHYQRTLLDLPWQGQSIRIQLTTRKLFCDNDDCSRRVFTQPLPDIAARYARKTTRLAQVLQQLVLLAGAEAAAKLAQALGLSISADAFLDGIGKVSSTPRTTPRVLGVDDFCFKRGQTYGTLLIDLERRQPIDLLPDREAKTLQHWLEAHPGIQIVTRDRSGEYARAITAGAPEAIQVADRFHLLVNLRDALKRTLDRFRPQLQGIELPRAEIEVTRPRRPEPKISETLSQVRHQQRQQRCCQIHELLQAGHSKRAIARELNLSPMTVYDYLRLDPQKIPRRSHASSSTLDPFLPYLNQRWADGCHNTMALWREIKEQGYPSTARMVRVWTHQQRTEPSPSTPKRFRVTKQPESAESIETPSSRSERSRTSSSRQFAWLLLKEPDSLTPGEQAVWQKIQEVCPDLARVRKLGGEFRQMVRERKVAALENWLLQTRQSGFPELVQFAEGILRDKACIIAALTCVWSNGQTEGQVNRLKVLKRQMYGRASFELLRARTLYRAGALTI